MDEDELCICSNCKYWCGDDDWGECRRSTPTITIKHEDGRLVGMWPETIVTDWCGEWKRMTPVPTVTQTIPEKENIKNN